MLNKIQISNPSENIQGNDTSETFHTGEFLFTKNIITYGSTTLQLSNVTKIKKYVFTEHYKPTYNIDKSMILLSFIAIIISVLALGSMFHFLGEIDINKPIVQVFGLIFLASFSTLIFSCYERRIKFLTDYTYGVLIETSSGKSEYLSTANKDFISKLFSEITKAMDKDDFPSIVADFSNSEIKFQKDLKIGKFIEGDNFEHIEGSNISNRSNNIS